MAKEASKKSFLDFFKMKDLDDDEFDDDFVEDDFFDDEEDEVDSEQEKAQEEEKENDYTTVKQLTGNGGAAKGTPFFDLCKNRFREKRFRK